MRTTWLVTAAILASGWGTLRAQDSPARLGLPVAGDVPVVPLDLPMRAGPGAFPAETELIVPTPPAILRNVPPGYTIVSGSGHRTSDPVIAGPVMSSPVMSGPVMPGYIMPPGGDMYRGDDMPIRSMCGGGRCYSGVRPAMHSTGPCGDAMDCSADSMSECSERPFLDNLSIFFGLQGSREPADLGINGLFGYRLHLNWGFPIVEDLGLGMHIGVGFNDSNNALGFMEAIGGPSDRTQFFLTLGVFQRTSGGLSWEFAWDYRHDHYYETISTSQWRGLISHSVGSRNEVGLWGAWRHQSEGATVAGAAFNLRPINQINAFWRHAWDNQIVTSFWAGVAEEHAGTFPFAATSHVRNPFVFGADLFVPLSSKLAIWGEANYITPNDSGTVTAVLGFAWFPGGRAPQQVGSIFAPPLPTANNTNFSLDVQP